jgi:ribonuclease G
MSVDECLAKCRNVWLKSGGSIVINPTEALVAIDANAGRYVGKKNAGRLETRFSRPTSRPPRRSLRQVRFRDLGGIIVLDFIDMEDKKNRQKVLQAVEHELRKDRAPSKALQVSDFGLSLERTLTEPCPYFAGSSVVKSSFTICYEILEGRVRAMPRQRRHRSSAACRWRPFRCSPRCGISTVTRAIGGRCSTS